jgi:hypothetical protein
MIKFAIKSLVVMVLVGHAIKLVEPAEPVAAAEPRFMPANYTEGAVAPAPSDVTSQLSTFTNAQIVVSHTARDAKGFCDREPLACQSGRELLARAAVGIRDLASGIAMWADDETAAGVSGENPDTDEYRPLADYRGPYPILPAPPPARNDTL